MLANGIKFEIMISTLVLKTQTSLINYEQSRVET
jgi:hypothetical protein